MKKALLTSLVCLSLSAYALDDSSYSEFVTDKSVSYESEDGTARAELTLLDPIANIPTTKKFAEYVMDSYQGWDLKPLVDVRGFSFKYVDNGPCAGLVTYFDGRSYLLFKCCGITNETELKNLFERANKKLKLTENLKVQSKPNLY